MAQQPDPAPLAGHKILVVDDEDDARTFIATVLEDAGAEIIEADDGDRALVIARKERPDAITLDISMPGRDGVEVFYVGQMHVRKVGSHKTYMSQRELLKVVATTTWRMFRLAATLPTDAYQICKAQPINGLAALLAH